MSFVDDYLDRVMLYANLSDDEADRVRSELQDHLMQKIEDLRTEGLSAEDAAYRAVKDHGHPRVVGYGLRKKFPLVDVRMYGTARGVIAIGPRAVGVVAMGGTAFGVFAFGAVAVGVVGMGGLAVCLLFAFAGCGISAVSFSGFALGLLAYGGFAVGAVAYGGFALGLWARGGQVASYYTADNVPDFLTRYDGYLMGNELLPVWFQLAGVIVFLVILATVIRLQRKEARRVRMAEPWLLE